MHILYTIAGVILLCLILRFIWKFLLVGLILLLIIFCFGGFANMAHNGVFSHQKIEQPAH